MRIYIFVDYYPNPYKPYFDTQFISLIKQGHKISIFSAGAYTSTVNTGVEEYQLMDKTQHYPRVIRDLPAFIPAIFYSVLKRMFSYNLKNTSIFDCELSAKENFLNMCRAFIINSEPPDICLIHNLDISSIFTFLKAKYPESKVAMYYHGGEVGRTPTVSKDKYSFKSMDKVITNTMFSKNQAIERGCEKSKISIVPVGFDLNYYPDIKKTKYRDAGILRLISVGRLSEEKGISVALEAMKKLLDKGISNWNYKIIGNGYIFQALKEQVNKLNLNEHVKFLGEKNVEDVSTELGKADVLILPSLETERWSETQACVVQEAMLMKCVVITTKTGGVPESICDGMYEFSVTQNSSIEISNKIEKILSFSDGQLKLLGEQGRNFVINNYEINKITDCLVSTIVEF